jgi:hypothetical protein
VNGNTRSTLIREALPEIGTTVAVGVAQRNDAARALAFTPCGHIDVAIRRDREMPRWSYIVGKYSCAESIEYHEPRLAGGWPQPPRGRTEHRHAGNRRRTTLYRVHWPFRNDNR